MLCFFFEGNGPLCVVRKARILNPSNYLFVVQGLFSGIQRRLNLIPAVWVNKSYGGDRNFSHENLWFWWFYWTGISDFLWRIYTLKILFLCEIDEKMIFQNLNEFTHAIKIKIWFSKQNKYRKITLAAVIINKFDKFF